MHVNALAGLLQESPGAAQQSDEENQSERGAAGTRLVDSLASYLIRITLKTLISSSASLLAYFHEVFTTSVFLYSKGLSSPYRSDFFLYKLHFSYVFIRRKGKKTVLKCPCSFLQSLVLERLGCTYRKMENGPHIHGRFSVFGHQSLCQVVAVRDTC